MACRSVDARGRADGARVTTETIREKVRRAAAAGDAIRVSGAGTWMSAGRPVGSSASVSVASENGIVDYVPDDLTITVRAGTTHDELAAATRANGQWLPLDPPGSSRATVGATIATASSGPLAHSSGFARDFILGLEFVTGKGDVVRSGGRVVKNVAGFDLMRLMCGSWGTLGVITQATFRLYALPKIDRTFAIAVPHEREGFDKLVELLRNAPLAALSMEIVNGALAAKLGLSPQTTILIRLGGNSNVVEAQLKTLASLGSPVEIGGGIWNSFSETVGSGAEISLRLSGLPTTIEKLWRRAEQIADGDRGGYVHSTFSRGIVRVARSSASPLPTLPRSENSQRVTFESLPSESWKNFSPSVVADRLSRSVKRAYDPSGVLNPGILG
jgi:glycolate oxidase FAD binding subunit